MRGREARRVLVTVSVAFLFAALSLYFDNDIILLISHIKSEILTNFFFGITFASSLLVIFIFLTLLFIKEKKGEWILPLWITLIINLVVGFLLKIFVQRQRPFQVGLVNLIEGLQSSSFNTWDWSFPSLQAMIVFCAVPFLSKEFPKFRYVWIIFACLVAFSRVYFGVHFLSDVIVGGIIGYLIGWFIVKRVENR